MGRTMIRLVIICTLATAFAAPTAEVVPEETAPGAGLVQESAEISPLAGGMLDGVACKLRKAVELANSNAKGKEALTFMKSTPAWKAHATVLNSLMKCIEDTSKNIHSCDPKVAPLVPFMFQLLGPMQAMMAKMKAAIPHFKSKV